MAALILRRVISIVKKVNKKSSGVITVFISLSLLIMMSILFTLLESARSEGLRLKAQLVANSSIESVFASYDRYLWEDYGLLYFAGRDDAGEELTDIARNYAQKNDGSYYSWLNLDTGDVSICNLVKATDNNGEIFIRSVIDYMEEIGILEDAASLIDEEIFSGASSSAIDETGEIDLKKIKDDMQSNEDRISKCEKNEEIKDEEKLKDEYNEAKNDLKTWAQKGVLSLVCDDAKNISDKPYDKEGSPSSISQNEKNRTVCEVGEASTYERLLFDQFIISKFNSYDEDSKDALMTEYIICGSDSDLSNLSSIAKRIVAIRFGIDYVKIRSNGEKYARAYAIGTAIAGWTGIPSLVTAAAESMLVIWAISDAITDAKEIFAGEKDDMGLSYKEYLRGFLAIEASADKAYRTMDAIQWRVQEEESAFKFSNCVYAARVSIQFIGDSLFPLLPATLNYSFDMETAYAYGEVARYR